ncbi:MAG: amino acid racemase [Oscillospiraceae bacterium]|nr:amino acid racemase [Oscillospiraceae bacterium]
MRKKYEKLGILGGMGPLATYTLYKNIIEDTPAERDQEHIDMVILNAAYIPDRTNGILHGGKSPLPELLDALKILESSGCDLVAIPCNTSHYFYDEMQDSCKIKILNMIELTAEKLNQLGVSKAFLTATEGTVKTGIYQKYCARKNIEIVSPDNRETDELTRIIYEIKAGKNPDVTELKNISEKYYNLGCEKIILGCTELSLIPKKYIKNNSPETVIDAMDILKDKILESFGIKNKIT